jgi:hypothetical protein
MILIHFLKLFQQPKHAPNNQQEFTLSDTARYIYHSFF